MGNLGVSDRYIDAFCGRTPKTVLARHYTDYNPERLKKIYDKKRESEFSSLEWAISTFEENKRNKKFTMVVED